MKMKNRKAMEALFVQGNSLKHIRSGAACFSDKGKNITRAIFGEGVKKMINIKKKTFCEDASKLQVKNYGII